MDDDHKLIKYSLDGRHVFWELTGSSRGKSELQKLMDNPRTKGSCHKLFSQIAKIIDYGVRTSCGTGKLRCLDAALGLYEIKGFDGVNREMAYILCKEPAQVVLLRWFKGHQGSGNIQAEIDLSSKLAIEAAKQLKLVNDPTEESA